jgi:hypothetical protein
MAGRRSVAISLYCVVLFAAQSLAADCEKGVPAILEGEVVIRKQAGPPGWGEDPARDSHWAMAVLVLGVSSEVTAKTLLEPCGERAAAVKEVQLWPTSIEWKQHDRRKVRVKGLLHPASGAPAEILPLQFEVSAFEYRRPPRPAVCRRSLTTRCSRRGPAAHAADRSR